MGEKEGEYGESVACLGKNGTNGGFHAAKH